MLVLPFGHAHVAPPAPPVIYVLHKGNKVTFVQPLSLRMVPVAILGKQTALCQRGSDIECADTAGRYPVP